MPTAIPAAGKPCPSLWGSARSCSRPICIAAPNGMAIIRFWRRAGRPSTWLSGKMMNITVPSLLKGPMTRSMDCTRSRACQRRKLTGCWYWTSRRSLILPRRASITSMAAAGCSQPMKKSWAGCSARQNVPH